MNKLEQDLVDLFPFPTKTYDRIEDRTKELTAQAIRSLAPIHQTLLPTGIEANIRTLYRNTLKYLNAAAAIRTDQVFQDIPLQRAIEIYVSAHQEARAMKRTNPEINEKGYADQIIQILANVQRMNKLKTNSPASTLHE